MYHVMRVPYLALLLVAITTASDVTVAAATSSDPEAVVQAQLDAYNAHNVEAFVATYAEDVLLFEHPAKLLAAGSTQLRERYAPRFKDSILHSTVVKRIVMGNVVVDHENVILTLPEGSGSLQAVAIYEVQNGKIAKAWLIYGPKMLNAK